MVRPWQYHCVEHVNLWFKNQSSCVSSLWFQPIRIICSSNWITSPGKGENKPVWNHHLGLVLMTFLDCFSWSLFHLFGPSGNVPPFFSLFQAMHTGLWHVVDVAACSCQAEKTHRSTTWKRCKSSFSATSGSPNLLAIKAHVLQIQIFQGSTFQNQISWC